MRQTTENKDALDWQLLTVCDEQEASTRKRNSLCALVRCWCFWLISKFHALANACNIFYSEQRVRNHVCFRHGTVPQNSKTNKRAPPPLLAASKDTSQWYGKRRNSAFAYTLFRHPLFLISIACNNNALATQQHLHTIFRALSSSSVDPSLFAASIGILTRFCVLAFFLSAIATQHTCIAHHPFARRSFDLHHHHELLLCCEKHENLTLSFFSSLCSQTGIAIALGHEQPAQAPNTNSKRRLAFYLSALLAVVCLCGAAVYLYSASSTVSSSAPAHAEVQRSQHAVHLYASCSLADSSKKDCGYYGEACFVGCPGVCGGFACCCLMHFAVFLEHRYQTPLTVSCAAKLILETWTLHTHTALVFVIRAFIDAFLVFVLRIVRLRSKSWSLFTPLPLCLLHHAWLMLEFSLSQVFSDSLVLPSYSQLCMCVSSQA